MLRALFLLGITGVSLLLTVAPLVSLIDFSAALGSHDESVDWSSFQLPSDLHSGQSTVDMVIVHVEVVSLERVAVHTCVDRPQVGVELSPSLVEVDYHFVSCDMNGLEDDLVTILSHLAA